MHRLHGLRHATWMAKGSRQRTLGSRSALPEVTMMLRLGADGALAQDGIARTPDLRFQFASSD
jgi:hypothetical protein